MIEVDDKDNVIAEARESMSCRHGDDERKHVIDECVECLKHTNSDADISTKLYDYYTTTLSLVLHCVSKKHEHF